ncbi:MAG: hypothetical protein AB7N65_23380 [Vicinamibacterales bacterium]
MSLEGKTVKTVKRASTATTGEMATCPAIATIASCLLLTSALVAAAGAPDAAPRSAALAKQLTAALQDVKLQAIAARDPEDPERFVAALYYPNAQLLVISARSTSPSLLESRLAYKQYQDIYADLQGSPVKGTSLFFQDMKADGLCAGPDQATDIFYSPDGKTVILDGDGKKRGLSSQEYERQFTDVDAQYSRLLSLLLAQVRPT